MIWQEKLLQIQTLTDYIDVYNDYSNRVEIASQISCELRDRVRWTPYTSIECWMRQKCQTKFQEQSSGKQLRMEEIESERKAMAKGWKKNMAHGNAYSTRARGNNKEAKVGLHFSPFRSCKALKPHNSPDRFNELQSTSSTQSNS